MIKKFIPHKLTRILVYLLLILPTLLFVVVTVAYFIYLFWPHDLSKVTDFPIESDTQHLVLTAHGVKDSPNNWGVPLLRVIDSTAPNNQKSVNIDWRPYSNNPLICSVVGERIGEAVAERIVAETEVKSIHAIGHSCGAFVVYGLSRRINSLNSEVKVHTTYLDPVAIYAGIFWNYGVDNFGQFADFSDAYIDTEDGVPGSNSALKHAISFDVTAIKHQQNQTISPHNWPPHFYINAVKAGRLPLLNNNLQLDSKLQKGTLYDFENR